MKTFLLSVAMAMLTIASISQTINQDSKTKNLLTSKRTSTNSESVVNAAWLSAAQNNIAEEEYYFKKKNGSSNLFFCAANRQQQAGFDINPSGYSVYPVTFTSKPVINRWREQLSFLSIQKGDDTLLSKNGFDVTEGTTAMSYQYQGFSIQYINDKQGLRQNFIIDSKQAGNGNVQLFLHIDGTLSPIIKNNALQFEDETGANLLYYRDLHVWDANHKMLDATMELNNQNLLVITVNDKNAKYPVTIDPINQTAEWAGTATGILPTLTGQLAIDAAYGFSVAGLGDINGDGYDDVAIGAPTLADIISNSGELASVGAVFVYYGSAAGLSATPGTMLQPTTCIAGALFGYSIAGGDINADGKSDIIVGAPLDNVSISIGGGHTASGTVGKVYVFNGATLATTTTPLLTLQLSGNGILENNVNLSINALFGFSVAVTEDMNGDGKRDIIVGSPAYAGISTGLLGNSILDVQSGGAFVFLSNASNNNQTLVKLQPIKTDLLGLGLLQSNIGGLLFGYSVDGLGDYNGDGKPDVVVGAPAGVDLSSINGLLNGKVLQGSALVYYGTGSGVNTSAGATLTATSGGLLTNLVGSLANLANLFGVSVKGVRNAAGARNGNVLVGAPLGGAITNVLSLQLKAGTVNVFKKKTSSPSGYVTPDQVLSSPRNSNSILSLIQCNLLFGYALDNTLDVNCDGYADIIVGEPASSGVQLISANVAGGAAYVYLGKSDGTYQTLPAWTLTANADAFLGVNATSLIGYSVAGIGHVKGFGNSPRILVGSPSRTLDFGTGLLNLGNTFGTLFGLVAGDNGVGKAYAFDSKLCSLGGPLPVTLGQLKAGYNNNMSHLTWNTMQENSSNYFELQHSSDGIHFTTIGKVAAAGFSNKEINYVFDDSKVNNGNNYYRIKMVDANGNYQYSNIVLVKATVKGITIASVYPSPFVDKVKVDVSSESTAQVSIRIVDNTGKLLINKTSGINKGFSSIGIAGLGGLSKGLYMIEIQCGDKVTTQKLFKQ